MMFTCSPLDRFVGITPQACLEAQGQVGRYRSTTTTGTSYATFIEIDSIPQHLNNGVVVAKFGIRPVFWES